MTRLVRAAVLDARDVAVARVMGPVRVIGFLVSMVSTSTVCRIRGHELRIVACPEVVRLCVRCGGHG